MKNRNWHLRIVLMLWGLAFNMTVLAQSERSNELFAKGVELYRAGKYQAVIPVFEELDALDRQEMDTTNARYGYSRSWLSSCWYKLGKVEKAKDIDNTDYECIPVDRRLTYCSDSLFQIARMYFETDNNEKAYDLFIQCIKKQGEEIPHMCPQRIISFIYKSFSLQGMNKIDDAVSSLRAAKGFCEQVLSPDNEIYTDVLEYLYKIPLAAGRLEEGGEAIAEFAEHLRDIGKDHTVKYLELMQTGLQLACNMGDAEAVKEGYPTVLELVEEHYGASSEEYINQVGTVANMLSLLGDTASLQIGERFCQLAKAKCGPESMAYYKACANMATFAGKAMRTDLMRKYLKEGIRLSPILEPDHPENIPLSKILLAMSFLLEDADSASVLADEGMRGLAESGLTDSPYYAGGQYVQGVVNLVKGQYQEAESLLSASIGKVPVTDSVELYKNQLWMSFVHCMNGNYVEGRNLGLQAISQIREILESPWKGAASRGMLPMLSQIISIYDNARVNSIFTMPDSVKYTYGLLHSELLMLQMDQIVKLDSFETADFFNAMEKYGNTSFWTHDYLRTRKVVSAYTDVVKRQYGEQSWEYDRCLDALLPCYEDHDAEKLRLYEQQIALEQKLYGKKHDFVLDKMEKYYKLKGDDEALLAIKSRHRNRNTGNGLQMADIYKANDNYESALRYYRKSLTYQTKNKDDIYELYSAANGILSCIVMQEGNSRLPTELVDIMKQVQNRRPALFNQLLYLLAKLNFQTQDVSTYEKCVDALAKGFPAIIDARHYACLLIRGYETGYVNKENCESVLALFDKALNLAKPQNKRLYDEIRLSRLKADFDGHYSYFGLLDSEDASSVSGIGSQIEKLLKDYPDYPAYTDYRYAIALQLKAALLLDNMSEINRLSRMLLESMQTHPKDFYEGGEMARIIGVSNGLSRDLIADFEMNDLLMEAAVKADGPQKVQSGILSLKNRLGQLREQLTSTIYRSSVQGNMEKLMQQAASLAYSSRNDSLIALAYDISIFCKGALLRSENLMARHIQNQGNETARQTLDDLRETTLKLDDVDRTMANVDSLLVRKKKLEAQLMDESSMFGDYSKAMSADWQDIQKKLQDGDVAIEFCQFEDNDMIRYCALMLKPQEKTPCLVPLCTDIDIKGINSLYGDARLYQLVWQPIEKYLSGVKRIYFSPSGLLHQIAIENVSVNDHQKVSDRYALYRMSNTRELMTIHAGDNIRQSALLIGGVVYELDADEWQQIAEHATEAFDDLELLGNPPSFRGIGLRGAQNYLVGTEVEVDEITDQLKSSKIPNHYLKGVEATEGSFKRLCSNNYSILHIATHGFYLPDDTIMSKRGYVDESSREDMAMNQCGLLLAGAVSCMKGMAIPEKVDDGILTAREVSRLDLTSISLVTLSACETALGEVTGEGVFGLQRGFKKAGANSILMSLWKVDDEATCLLMTEFYKNWIGEGKSKHDALELAKQTVRSHKEKGWNDPKYWAAFILLDALD